MSQGAVPGAWTEQYVGTPLDLTEYHPTFADEFDSFDIVPDSGTGTWYAPVHSNYGAAKFIAPDAPTNPFSVSGGQLTITMSQVNGTWQSGTMQTMNSEGEGFAQTYGYFEMRAAFTGGKGAWPAFWMLPQDETIPRTEIDIVEAYGNDPAGHHQSVHVTHDGIHDWDSNYQGLARLGYASSMFDGTFHTYGVEITQDWIIDYFDGKEISRFPMNDYFRNDHYLVVTLAMYGPEVAQASGTYKMVVDYVHAYSATPVNGAPTTTPVTLTGIAEDSGVRVITQAELLANASDVDNTNAQLSATSLALSSGGGSLVNNGNGTWNYTPALNDDTSVAFSYMITDGSVQVAGSASLDITPVNDAPTITSPASKTIDENLTAVMTVTSVDVEGATLSYSIVAGVGDSNSFTINQTTGALAFVAPPDFENPQDSGANNVYDVRVRVSDGVDSSTQDIGVTINNVAGNMITGNDSANTVNATQTVAGQPLPTSEDDFIDGRGGADNLSGLGGNDTYVVDVTNDVITEQAGGGIDLVRSTAASFTLGNFVENLTLLGTGNINGTGNSLANVLTGNAGNNTLDGTGGADTMIGLAGNDLYVVDDAGDVVDELIAGSSGVDEVKSSISFSLIASANLRGTIENLTLTGSADLSGTGNSSANVITGNNGKNTLIGNDGNDNLFGNGGDDRLVGGLGTDSLDSGSGKDTFVFSTALNAVLNTDTIDFSGQDKIELSRAIFTSLTGQLASTMFRSGTSAQDQDDFIIYDRNTGALSYDADGNLAGGVQAIQFAVVSTKANLAFGDFTVVP